MTKLRLSVAMGDYDRTRALLDGRVQIDGVNPVFMALSPEETFFRALRQQAFDISELSLSSYVVQAARGECPYVAVPVFLSRAFRHTSIWVRKDRVRTPQDLKGKRVGVPEYQLTANVWARAILQDDHGVQPRDIRWVRGGIDDAAAAREDRPGAARRRARRACARRAARSPTCSMPARSTASSRRVRPPVRPRATRRCAGCSTTPPRRPPTGTAAPASFRSCTWWACAARWSTRHPWLPVAVLKAFTQAKAVALDALADTSATKVTLPFVEEQLKTARETLGEDFWSYGVAGNEATLQTFLRHHHEQGLSARAMSVDELFHPSTYESHRI